MNDQAPIETISANTSGTWPVVATERPPSLGPLFAALAKARGEFPEIIRNRIANVKMKAGGSYSYSYADLSDVFKAVNPVLAAYGLAVIQYPTREGLKTVITHESGAVFEPDPWPIKSMPGRGIDDAQSYQTSVQVAKRYALTAALGITTEETVEGHTRLGRDTQIKMDDRFETGDGIRLPRGAKIEKSWDAKRIAKEVARAIEEQMREAKTTVGVEGVWDRNAIFVEKLGDKYPDLYNDLFDIYNTILDDKDRDE